MSEYREESIPLQDFLGLRVVTAGSPSRLEIDLTDNVRGAVAPLHGGVLATLIDVACGFAAASGLTDHESQVPVSTDLTVRFLRQPKSSPLVAQAEVVHAGRSAVLVDCVVTDGEGRQVGRGSGSYRIITGFHAQGEKQ
jgi:uncharacterized protein (TIGR00369 family)